MENCTRISLSEYIDPDQSQRFDHSGRNELWREPYPPARTCDTWFQELAPFPLSPFYLPGLTACQKLPDPPHPAEGREGEREVKPAAAPPPPATPAEGQVTGAQDGPGPQQPPSREPSNPTPTQLKVRPSHTIPPNPLLAPLHDPTQARQTVPVTPGPPPGHPPGPGPDQRSSRPPETEAASPSTPTPGPTASSACPEPPDIPT